MPYRLQIALILIALLLLSGNVLAENKKAAPIEPPTISVPKLEGDIHVDGLLDEPQWEQATQVTGFHPYTPTEDFALPGKTLVRVFYNDEMIYFGFRCQSDNPKTIRAHMNPREDINFDDQVGIYLDTYNDNRQAFVFYISALGIQQDIRVIDNGSWNMSWDTVLYSKGRVDDEGYTVEVGIPFRSLRFPNKEKQQWGLIFTRKFGAEGSKAIWPQVTRDLLSMIAQAATMEGLEGIASSKNIEIQPTLVTQWDNTADESGANGSEEALKAYVAPGLDNGLSFAPGLGVKYGITSNLTLDATFNPDFSQVESDPDQLEVNQRQALYYQERRPFFLEGSEVFGGGQYLTLYSRTIVRPLWGIKLSGKEGKTSIGFLSAYDTAPAPSLTFTYRTGTPGFEGQDLLNADGKQRGAMVSVARVARDVGNGSLVALTFADKEVMDLLGEGGAYGYNRLAMVDTQFRLGQHDRLVAAAEYAFTGMRGGEQMSGPGYYTTYEHNHKVFYLNFTHGWEPPEFRDEIAYLPLTGVMFNSLYSYYRFEAPFKGVQVIQPAVNVNQNFEVGDLSTNDFAVSPNLFARFANQIYFNGGVSRRWEYFYETYLVDSFYLDLWSDRQRWISWEVGASEGDRIYYSDGSLGYAISPWVNVTLRPLSWFKATFGYNQETYLESQRFSLLYAMDRLTGKDTPAVGYRQSAARGVLNFTFSQAWSLRAIMQSGVILDNHRTWNVLLTYMPHPGTAAYLGISRNVTWDEFTESEGDWRIFFKLSYLWRV